jgi:hypothetical protein
MLFIKRVFDSVLFNEKHHCLLRERCADNIR